MVFSICQGSVQVLMNRYQIGRLYNLVARGQASRMDVTAETVDARFVPSMGFLMPFLLMVQLFQAYNAFTIFSFAYHTIHPIAWQSIAIGLIFTILSTGNLWTTLGTFIRKRVASSKQLLASVISTPRRSDE
jgi:hypothetical protein